MEVGSRGSTRSEQQCRERATDESSRHQLVCLRFSAEYGISLLEFPAEFYKVAGTKPAGLGDGTVWPWAPPPPLHAFAHYNTFGKAKRNR